MTPSPDTVPCAVHSPVSSKLPRVGTTIFTVMSELAHEHHAVNLGQGFPDFECDPKLIDHAYRAMRAGQNQYPPMAGVINLRQSVAAKIQALYGRTYDPDLEVTITAGATQAIMTAVLCLVRPGDEVIILEPAYDSYVPAIELAGGRPIFVRMRAPQKREQFTVPWDQVRAAITQNTRLIMINSPHNPTGAVFTAADLAALEEIVARSGIFVISDEVYEHMVFDDVRHESVARYPLLSEHSLLISSFGKTFHVTGWKVGYVAAPARLSAEFRKVHQFNVFTVNTPMQYALAAYMEDPAPYLMLAQFYQQKRDYFLAGLAQTRLDATPCAGTYFQLVRYEAVENRCGHLSEADFCRWLTRNAGVAAIPVSAFYDTPVESGVVRLCFAKTEATLQTALDRLAQI